MRVNTLLHLRCPFCSGELAVRHIAREAENRAIQFGTVACKGCSSVYPVVARVLILGTSAEHLASHEETTEWALRHGPTLGELCDLLDEGNIVRAFTLALMPSGKSPDLLFRRPTSGDGRHEPLLSKPVIPVRVQRLIDRHAHYRLSVLGQARLARILLAGLDSLSAVEAIELCYGAFSRSELSNYFTFRFGQPRHLAALSVASVVTRPEGPLLDLACGAGHLTHYLCATERRVMGVDRDYLRLFLAANFVAPAADFVCAWADRPLPFPTGVFAGALCSDAFHFFVNKSGCIRELLRVVVERGVIAIARAANANLSPHEGYELTPAGYSQLCGDLPHSLHGEEELTRAYLSKAYPDLRPPASDTGVADKWVSMLIARKPELLRPHGGYPAWPHALGQLGINPIYDVVGVDHAGNLELAFRFPSEHYATEDAAYTRYAPPRAKLPRRVLDAVARGELGAGDPELEQLVRSFVLIGMPDRYMPDPLHSRAFTHTAEAPMPLSMSFRIHG